MTLFFVFIVMTDPLNLLTPAYNRYGVPSDPDELVTFINARRFVSWDRMSPIFLVIHPQN
jgi:hypothetical protein